MSAALPHGIRQRLATLIGRETERGAAALVGVARGTLARAVAGERLVRRTERKVRAYFNGAKS